MDKVSEIVAELQICYATEIEVIQNYLANAIDLEGSRAEPVKALFDDEVQTALAHARRLAKRIKALDAHAPPLPRLLPARYPCGTATAAAALWRARVLSLSNTIELRRDVGLAESGFARPLQGSSRQPRVRSDFHDCYRMPT